MADRGGISTELALRGVTVLLLGLVGFVGSELIKKVDALEATTRAEGLARDREIGRLSGRIDGMTETLERQGELLERQAELLDLYTRGRVGP